MRQIVTATPRRLCQRSSRLTPVARGRVSCRRSGWILTEMLIVLVAVTVGMTIMFKAIVAICDLQGQAVALTDRYTITHDFFANLRRDVRGADSMSLTSDGKGGQQILLFDRDGERITYAFASERVEREGSHGDPISNKSWSLPRAQVVCDLVTPPAGGAALLDLDLIWRRLSAEDLQPSRRFSMACRCVGEQYDILD